MAEKTSQHFVRVPRRSIRILKTLAALLLPCIVAFAISLFGAGRWLVKQNALQRSGAIVVLSGRMPLRAVEAARLYKEGWAPQVWITRPAGVAEEMQELGVPFVREEDYSRQVLLKLGVPESSIRTLEPEIESTADEVRVIGKEMKRLHLTRTILVTTKVHTRRVHTLWRKLENDGDSAVVHGAENDPFDPARWYGNTRDALDVVREYLGLLNAWAGLPLRSAH